MKLTTEQLQTLIDIVDYRIDYWVNNEPEEEGEQAELSQLEELLPILRSQKDTQEATETERPRLATYQVLTGTSYEVEATSEEEALNRFHDWYKGYNFPIEDELQFTDTVIEEGEALTIVIGHD